MIAEVDEQQLPVVALSMDPAGHADRLTDMLQPQLIAGVGTIAIRHQMFYSLALRARLDQPPVDLAGQLGSRDRHLLSTSQVFYRGCASRLLVVSHDNHEWCGSGGRVSELLGELVWLRVHVNPEARVTKLGSQGQRVGLRGLIPDGHHHVGVARDEGFRKHPTLVHDDENPLEAEREPTSRDALAEKGADQVV